MKISAFVLMLSMLANLSFASFTENSWSIQTAYENVDTVSRDGLTANLIGEWTNIGLSKKDSGFASLSLLANGKFSGTAPNGQRICGQWEVSKDGLSLVMHKICEETGEKTGTVVAQIELVDGHMLTLEMPGVQGGKQTFIQ